MLKLSTETADDNDLLALVEKVLDTPKQTAPSTALKTRNFTEKTSNDMELSFSSREYLKRHGLL